MKTLLLVLTALLCTSLVLAQYETDGYAYVVARLSQFQTRTGGFKLRELDTTPSVTATADAIFLSSLYGLRQQISPIAVDRYLSSLATEHDAGYGKSAGLASDIESSREAVLSYSHLGRQPPVSPVKYVRNLLDKDTHLFSRSSQGKADLVATATALQILDQSRETGKQWVQDLFPFLRSYLDSHKNQSSEGTYFYFGPSQSVLTGNYYGIVIGSLVGYDFSNGRHAKFIASQQASTGGFYADLQKSQVTVEASAHAVLSLASLSSGSVSDAINTDSLFAYFYENTPRDLHSAALAHSAVALTNNFRRNFNFNATYDVFNTNNPVDRSVVQGTTIKPVLNIKTIFGVPHAGLDVTVAYSDPTSKANTYKLKWRENHKYSSDDYIDTSNLLGSLNFRYSVRVQVAGLPPNAVPQFDFVDVKRVGYGMSIVPKASSDVAGRNFQPGEAVAIGTQFDFSLDLNNVTHARFPSKGGADVEVVFSVLDSSNVVIHESRQTVKADNSFSYTLTNSDLPAGALSFRFQVGQDSNIHTEEIVEYQVNIPMIASKINFDGFSATQAPNYKIGDVVRVSMEPASFPDFRNKYPFSSTDANGKAVGSQRQFYLDVKSNNGVIIRSVLGQSSKKSATYSFEVPVDASLDSIGNNVVSFRYLAANGNSFALTNFDSQFDEVFEDNNVLNYTIQSQLQIADVAQQPNSEDYFYGNEIVFRFRVRDAVSGKYITRGSSERANVYLTLTHGDDNKGKPFVSAVEGARQIGDEFVIQWPINPNAVQGAGVLSVNAQDVDGNQLALYKSGSLEEVMTHDVNITGRIEVRENTFTTSVLSQEKAAFVVEFNLSCNSRGLRDAQLRASVVLEGSRGSSRVLASGLPVATNSEGRYSVSYTAPLAQVPSGRYTLNFYREVDRRRALDNRDYRQKQARREEEQRRRAETGLADDVEIVGDQQSEAGIESELTPLFSVSFNHDSPSVSKSPVRLEVVVLTILVGAFFYTSYQKKRYLTRVAK